MQCVHHAIIFKGVLHISHSSHPFQEMLHFLCCENQVLQIDAKNRDFRLYLKFLSPNTAKPFFSRWLHYRVEQIAHADTQLLE